MEKRKITKYDIIMCIVTLFGIAVVIITILMVNKVKKEEQEVNEVIIEEEPAEEIEEHEEPDLTLSEYYTELYKSEDNNMKDYDIQSINDIIKSNIVTYNKEINLELVKTRNIDINDVDATMFKEIYQVWYPNDGILVVIYNAKSDYINDIINAIRKFEISKMNFLDNKEYKNRYNNATLISYNNYDIWVVSKDSYKLASEIAEYMSSVDNNKRLEIENKYEVNEYGAYEKDKENIEINEETIEKEVEEK